MAKFQASSSRAVAKLAKVEAVSPSLFVDWSHMLFNKTTGRDFSSGPHKDHLKLGVKWTQLKVSFNSNITTYE